MVTDNIRLSPSTAFLEEQKVGAQPQHVPKPPRRSQKFKQMQDSSMSAKPFHPGNKMSFGQSDSQGLLGSSRVRLQENPKLLVEDLDKETSMSRPGSNVLGSPEHQIANNKEAGGVVMKCESFVPPMILEQRNEKEKQLQDSFAPTFSQMKLAYQQGLLGSSRICFQENPKSLEDLVKETSMYHPGSSVLQSLEHQNVTNKEAVVPPMISLQSLRKGKQKEIQESFPSTFRQMSLASQPPSAFLMNGPCLSERLSDQMNLLWLLQKQMQLSRTYEKRPEVFRDIRSFYKPGTCVQRVNQFMHRQHQRPTENNVEFWSNLVAEYFAPDAKKRLCLSSNSHREQISCIFPQEAWCCQICNVRPTAGFEITAEVLPRLLKAKFETGMLDELHNLGIPEECYTPSGHIVLNYAKVTEESVYEKARVVREGRLRVMFSADLKICNWEFCCTFHEVLINRRSVTPQVLQLQEAMEQCQVFAESNSEIPVEEFQRNSNKLVSAVHEIARLMDKSVINDLGYTKRYVRCLQISEVVSSMKDLMNYSKQYGIGPTEAMARIHRQSTAVSSLAHNTFDDIISHNSSVISFARRPSSYEGIGNMNFSPPAASPTSSTASSKRPVHQEDIAAEPQRKKQMTDSGENSVPLAPTEPVWINHQPIPTTPPPLSSSYIWPLVIRPSADADIGTHSSAMSVEPNEYLNSRVTAEADALIDTKVMEQNENNGKYYYGFETDGTVDKSSYMDQLENLNGASLFPGIHIGSPLTGTLVDHSNIQQSNDQLPYLNGEMDPIDDIQFD